MIAGTNVKAAAARSAKIQSFSQSGSKQFRDVFINAVWLTTVYRLVHVVAVRQQPDLGMPALRAVAKVDAGVPYKHRVVRLPLGQGAAIPTGLAFCAQRYHRISPGQSTLTGMPCVEHRCA